MKIQKWHQATIRKVMRVENKKNTFLYKIRDTLQQTKSPSEKYGLISMSVHSINNFVIGYVFRCKSSILAFDDLFLYCGIKEIYNIPSYKTIFSDKNIKIFGFDNKEVMVILS